MESRVKGFWIQIPPPTGVIGGSSPVRSGIFGTNINMNMALGGVQGSPIVSAKALRMTFLVSVDLANKKNSTESIEGEKTEFHQYSCHTHWPMTILTIWISVLLISVWEKEFLSAVDNLTVPEGLEIFKFAQRSFKDTAGASIRVSIIMCNWILRI